MGHTFTLRVLLQVLLHDLKFERRRFPKLRMFLQLKPLGWLNIQQFSYFCVLGIPGGCKLILYHLESKMNSQKSRINISGQMVKMGNKFSIEPSHPQCPARHLWVPNHPAPPRLRAATEQRLDPTAAEKKTIWSFCAAEMPHPTTTTTTTTKKKKQQQQQRHLPKCQSWAQCIPSVSSMTQKVLLSSRWTTW